MDTPLITTLCFFLSGVASLWRVCSSDLDYSQAAASSGLLILDEFLNGCIPQVRDQVLDGTQCSPGFLQRVISLWLLLHKACKDFLCIFPFFPQSISKCALQVCHNKTKTHYSVNEIYFTVFLGFIGYIFCPFYRM